MCAFSPRREPRGCTAGAVRERESWTGSTSGIGEDDTARRCGAGFRVGCSARTESRTIPQKMIPGRDPSTTRTVIFAAQPRARERVRDLEYQEHDLCAIRARA